MVPGEVKMYSCGPTVYGPIHIGNLRAALTADLFYRFFKHFGYRVTYVRNYTDIDDKIIHQAQKENTTCESITEKYIAYAEKDYALALMEEPTHKTRVTEHLPEIIEMIGNIIGNGKAYTTPSGDVYFSIDDFPGYGKLSSRVNPRGIHRGGADARGGTSSVRPWPASGSGRRWTCIMGAKT